MAECYLVCIEDKRYLLLGKWARPLKGASADAHFDGWKDAKLGRRLKPEETRRAIELFVAQSDGKTLRLVGERDMDGYWAESEDWHHIDSLQELVERPSSPPTEE